ncbi:hypothetical protein TRFO_15413 [Tritrichomonas foetus]|uniref:Uncharacterized protein n=1 Tax=Tritrichomonas foetus TaxID=1144522 RepID=A0A1J4KSJ3_9EUKA|nr:hypothetical protein TRFO_15413 [Tritrichomonas foetus]|eukprot:OHT14255.1 hypothetical protein TRFO_15413 [Tritrichomonas foetus]
MFKYKALEDRQILIEEIYAELEAILLQAEGNAQEEEEEEQKIIETANQEEEEEEEILDEATRRKKMQETLNKADPNEMTDNQRRRYFASLIAELEEKQALLRQSVVVINQIIRNNCI